MPAAVACAGLLLAATSAGRASNVTYSYNPNGQLTQVTYDNGTVVSYTYDANGNRTAAKVNTPALYTPTNLSATSPSGTTIDLTWTGSSGATGYYIWRCAGSGCTNFAKLPSTVSGATYSDTGLAGLTTYVYEVQAYKTSGSTTITSAQSASANATTGANPPTAPANLTAGVSGTSITLTWTASTDDVGIASYTLESCSGSSTCTGFGQPVKVTGATTYTYSGLSQGVTYRFEALATNTANQQSGWSNIATATAAVTTPPNPPSGLTGSAASWSTVNLSWSAATDPVAGVSVAGYKIYRNGNPTPIGSSTGTTYQDGTTAPSTTYSYTVSAYDAWGNISSPSSAVPVTTPPSPSPSTPGGLQGAPASDSSISLTWSASSDSGGPGIGGYKIYRNGTYVGASTTTSYTDTGLTTFSTYSYTVAAYDTFNTLSAQSGAASVTVGYEIANSTGLLAAGAAYSISQGEVPLSNSEYYWDVYAPNGQEVASAETGQNGYEPACYDDQQGEYSVASGYQLNECILWAAPSVYQR
ncbi:MAG TPA: fibronectin type III domain-containing protein [Steroidobacteraceae bacterium]|nr:fibronectin type III domain-containing protein [Steroidobacteraceae bacterium]